MSLAILLEKVLFWFWVELRMWGTALSAEVKATCIFGSRYGSAPGAYYVEARFGFVSYSVGYSESRNSKSFGRMPAQRFRLERPPTQYRIEVPPHTLQAH